MKNNKFLIAGIAVDNTVFNFDRIFSYKVPEKLKNIKTGERVLVPFGKGNRLRQGMVLSLEFCENDSLDESLKDISSLLDETPNFTPEMVDMVSFIHDRYYCTYYDAVRVMLPAGINYSISTFYSAKEVSQDVLSHLSDYEKEIYDYLLQQNKPVKKDIIIDVFSKGDSALNKLCRMDVLNRQDDAFRKTKDATMKMVSLSEDYDNFSVTLTPKQDTVYKLLKMVDAVSVKEICYYTGYTTSVIDSLVKKGIAVYFSDEVMRTPYEVKEVGIKSEDVVLSQTQESAFNTLYKLYKEEKPNVSLLYGVTGSGKTSVFMKLIEKCFKEGKGTILMVPEIALTPQLIKIFVSRFGENVAVFHSGLSLGERLDEYKRVLRGDAKIVLGTRSAVFAPLKNIGLIVLDEEQEASYKSQQTPRYHARDIAKFRCNAHKALLLLSSATPSIESNYLAEKGVYNKVTLNERYGTATLPKVSVVDMNEEIYRGNTTNYSQTLQELLAENLINKKQSIILLNRRGYNTFLSCKSCGEVLTCPNCSISMTYHSANNRMMCHYCGYSVPFTDQCPECHQKTLKLSGTGTQKAEQELLEMFPNARVLRMDTDATMTKSSYERKLTAFENGEYDILIGTQMVAKGLNFPNVTLVGVLNADQMLYADDYRSYERTFSLLTQVVGRSGRGTSKGVAVIQTSTPESFVIHLSAKQDYDTFYNGEIKIRKAMLYPPFADICLIGFSGIYEGLTLKCASHFQKSIVETVKSNYKDMPLRVIGPSQGSIYRINNKFRYKTIIKCRNSKDFRSVINKVLLDFSGKKEFRNVSITVDMNPLSFN